MSELMSWGRDTGTAKGIEGAWPESGRPGCYPLRLYQRTVALFFFFFFCLLRVLTNRRQKNQSSFTEELTACFAPAPERKPRGRGGIDRILAAAICRGFLKISFKSPEEVKMSRQCELWRGQAPPTRNYYKWGGTLCELCSIRTRGAPAIKPIKNWIPTRVPSFTSVCFVCRAVVNTSSACSMPPPATPHRRRCRLRSRLQGEWGWGVGECSSQRLLLN